MKNLTIVYKVILLVFLSIVSSLTIGIRSLYELKSAQDRFDVVQSQLIPGIILLNESNASSAAIRSAVRDYIIGGFIDDQKLQKIQLENINNLKNKILDNLNKYENNFTYNQADKQLIEKDRIALATYLEQVNDVFSKVEQKDVLGISQQFSETGKFRMTALALIKSFSEHASFNQLLSNKLKESGEAEAKYDEILMISTLVISVLIISLIGFIIYRSISKSLNKTINIIKDIENNLDFKIKLPIENNDEISQISICINSLVNTISNSILMVKNNANLLVKEATELANSSNQVAIAASQQSDAASSMAASIEELTVSINHVSDRSTDAHRLSVESGKYAIEGKKVISETVIDVNKISTSIKSSAERIAELEESSKEISTIISVIKEVADQTSLLALNAAIEAARAGEQGRGFAVVADEVKKLAERTSSSTKQITMMVESIGSISNNVSGDMHSIVDLVSDSVNRANNASKAIELITTSSSTAVSIVEEINDAIKEQSQASTNIASSIESVAQMSEESSAAAQSTSESANTLNEIAIKLLKDIDKYKV